MQHTLLDGAQEWAAPGAVWQESRITFHNEYHTGSGHIGGSRSVTVPVNEAHARHVVGRRRVGEGHGFCGVVFLVRTNFIYIHLGPTITLLLLVCFSQTLNTPCPLAVWHHARANDARLRGPRAADSRLQIPAPFSYLPPRPTRATWTGGTMEVLVGR